MKELRRVLRFRGVALVFRDGDALSVGDLDAESLAERFPTGAAADALANGLGLELGLRAGAERRLVDAVMHSVEERAAYARFGL